MNLPELQVFIDNKELDKLKSILEVTKYGYFISDSFSYAGVPGASSLNVNNFHIQDFRQYNTKQHDVFDTAKRRDKPINDDEGMPVDSVKVNRLGIPEQKKIVLLAASFLGVPELQSTPLPGIETDLLTTIEKVWEDNKYNYKFSDIVKTTMSERECAELWYTQPAEADYWEGTPMSGNKFKLRMRLLSASRGDTLYPVYDEYGDMVAFGRYYETIEAVANTGAIGATVYHLDIYTKDFFYYATKSTGEWSYGVGEDGMEVLTGVPNPLGKIPIIYYTQPATEWHDVQEMINRLEVKISNHADTNDYFDSPIIFAEGTITGFAEKGETGKLLQGTAGAKVSYLTWDQAPESTKMEIDHLINFIHTYTHTPNISFDNIKGLGTFTGIALKMFFMDAHLKAADNEAIYGLGVQRSVNYQKATLAKLNAKFVPALKLTIKPKFTFFLPKNEAEEIDNIIKCVNGGIMSIETAVKLNPLVEDHITELALIKKEKAEADAAAVNLAKQTKPVGVFAGN